VFSVLGENAINMEMISTSPIKISCVIRGEHVPRAVRALHAAFGLGRDAVREERPFERGPRDGSSGHEVAPREDRPTAGLPGEGAA